MPAPFHLAIPVHDLPSAREFYGALFGCSEGRSDREWVDFDFFGHQLVAHVDPSRQAFQPPAHSNKVDGKTSRFRISVSFSIGLRGMRWQIASKRQG